MAKYETMMVTTANLDEEASNALINKFKNLIAANGTIDSVGARSVLLTPSTMRPRVCTR